MSVEQLLQEHGMNPEDVVGWARRRASELLAEVDDPVLEALLSDVEVGPPPAFAESSHAESSRPESSHPEAGTDEELEELDVEELEELDFDEVDLVEDDDDGDDGGTGAEARVDSPDGGDAAGDHDFLGAGAKETAGEITYAPTDTQPLEAVDAEILEDSGSFAVDELEAEAEADADDDAENGQRRMAGAAEPSPSEVQDDGSGDLFDDDELDIDIEE